MLKTVKHISFGPFRAWFVNNHPTGRKKDLIKELNMSWKTLNKIWKDQLPIRTDVIEKIVNEFGLPLEQVIELKERKVEKIKKPLN